MDYDGTKTQVADINVDINTLINKFKLEQNYPNPFNPTTNIKYSIPFKETRHEVFVQLKVYNVLGDEIATLVNQNQSSGNYEIEFDGASLSSGIYYYKFTTGNVVQIKKMVLLK